MAANTEPPPKYEKDDPTKNGDKKDEPTEQPQRKIRVPTYRPNPRDFFRDLNFLLVKINSIRSTEPRVCDQMKERVNENLRRFNSLVFADWRRIQDTFQRSKSDKLSDAIKTTETAYIKSFDDFNKVADKSLKEIYDSCLQLRSYDTNKELISKIVQHQRDQFDTATTLSKMPEEYENKMQTHYTPIEKITGPL